MGAPYKNPPVAEAIAEFRFPQGSEPDLVVPGLVYEQLKGSFPTSRPAVGVEASVHATQGVIQQRLAQTPRLQLLSPDGRIIVQVSPNWLAVNHIPPYESWERYLPAIEQAFAAFTKASNVDVMLTASLRYVNHVSLNDVDAISLEDYFTVYPKSEGVPIETSSFRLGLQLLRDDGRSILQMEMEPAEVRGGRGVQLDLHYFSSGAAPIAAVDARAWLTRAHDEVEAFFERAIKDSLRERFGGTKETR